jgi:hypothetical protein
VFQRAGLGDAYRAAREDPEWLSLRDQIASIDTLLVALHTRLTGQSKSCHWEEARGLAQRYRALIDSKDDGASFLLENLLDLIEAGADEENTWAQIQRAMETRRRLTDVEGRMQDRLHQTFSVQQALAVIQALGQLSREFVPEERRADFVQRLRLIALGTAETTRGS